MGAAPQSFLGARWIRVGLKLGSNRTKRWLALRILALSPHYFFRNFDPKYARLSHHEFLEAEFERNRTSRVRIYNEILSRFLLPSDHALDYGCGPRFLAKEAAAHLEHVYAADISSGVLECARILGPASNLDYILLAPPKAPLIPSHSLDVVYSFAVIQHMTENAIENCLEICSSLLKLGGRLVFQVQLENPSWRTEEEYRADSSLAGKIKFRYAMHCFARTPQFFHNILLRFGFDAGVLFPISELCQDAFDDVCLQHLLVATKAHENRPGLPCDTTGALAGILRVAQPM